MFSLSPLRQKDPSSLLSTKAIHGYAVIKRLLQRKTSSTQSFRVSRAPLARAGDKILRNELQIYASRAHLAQNLNFVSVSGLYCELTAGMWVRGYLSLRNCFFCFIE